MIENSNDRATLGLSNSSYAGMEQMRDEGYFDDLSDCYRFALGLAIKRGLEPVKAEQKRTFVNVGSIDSDSTIRNLMLELYKGSGGATEPYALAEQLAEAGMSELISLAAAGQFKLSDLLD
jgi:hypothetical protein